MKGKGVGRERMRRIVRVVLESLRTESSHSENEWSECIVCVSDSNLQAT